MLPIEARSEEVVMKKTSWSLDGLSSTQAISVARCGKFAKRDQAQALALSRNESSALADDSVAVHGSVSGNVRLATVVPG